MSKNIFIAVMLLLSVVFNKSWADSYDSTNFSADGRKWQPVPSCSTPGKDNGPGIGTHNPGEDCGICHRPLNPGISPATPGKASKYIFTMSGTLYEDRTARKPLKNGEVILQDINGKVICLKSNDVGNFWTYTAIGSNPKAIGGYGSVLRLYTTDAAGFHPAPATDTRSWQYKTWVKNGDHVLPMVTIAPVGGGSDGTSRMSCSMHHSPMGTRGGLWASTKGTLPSYPATGLSFKKHILPIFMSKCAPCHIPGSTATRIVTKSDIDSPSTRIDYSKGLDLTSYSGSTVTIPTTDTVTPGTKKGVSDAGIRGSLPLKTDGTIVHAGGKFWTAGNPDYEAIKQWIAEGGQNN